MSSEEIQYRVIGRIAERAFVDVDDVTIKSELDMFLDEFDLGDCLGDIEEDFGISLPEDVPAKVVTIGDVVEYVKEYLPVE